MLFLCVLRVLCGESVFFRAENKFTLLDKSHLRCLQPVDS